MATCYLTKILALSRLNQFNNAFYLLNEGSNFAKAKGMIKMEAFLYLLEASILIEQDRTLDALEIISKALEIFKSQHDTFHTALAYQYLGFAYMMRNQIVLSQENLSKSYSYFEKLNATRQLGTTCTYMADNYLSLENLASARQFCAKAIDIAVDLQDTLGLIAAYSTMSVIHKDSNMDSVGYYLMKSTELTKTDTTSLLFFSLQYNLALYYLNLGDFEKAKAQINKVSKQYAQLGYVPGIFRVLTFEALLSNITGNNDSAQILLNKAIQLVDSTDFLHLQIKGMQNLANLYADQQKDDLAAEIKASIISLRDSMPIKQASANLQLSEKIFDLERKKTENETLIEDLKETKRKLTLHTILLIVALPLFFLFFFIYKRRYLNRLALQQAQTQAQNQAQSANGINGSERIKPNKKHTFKTPEELYLAIFEWLKTEKAYLNPNLKIKDVENAFDIPYAKLNEAFKAGEFKIFKKLVNHLRVEYAKSMLENPAFDTYTIETIASESGFGTRQAFYKAFEAVTSQTPTEYKENLPLSQRR